MAAMKDLFTDLQEQVYSKLENIGVSINTIFKFEKVLIGQRCGSADFQTFSEKMAGYAMAIYFLSGITGYTQERLWSIWLEMAEDAIEDDLTELDEAWESFKATTKEKDW